MLKCALIVLAIKTLMLPLNTFMYAFTWPWPIVKVVIALVSKRIP
jgi:hypothetical protein